MPVAILRTESKRPDGRVKTTDTSKTITHNNARLYHEGGRSYEYIGNDASGNRIYRDTSKR